MVIDAYRPHAFREQRVDAETAEVVAGAQCVHARARAGRASGCHAWAVHLAKDRTRVVVVESWRSEAAYRSDAEVGLDGAELYVWVGSGGLQPTPVTDGDAGVIVIDIFSVWRPLARPVSAFNLRNGRAFNRQPGCVSTTVLRAVTSGRIATYARWRTEADFVAAFVKVGGAAVDSIDGINAAAARMTRGLIRPDYHSYDLFAFEEKER